MFFCDGVSRDLTEVAEETAVNLANACWQRTRCDDSARKDDLWSWDTPCRLLNFANGYASVCVNMRVYARVHVRGGVESGRKTRRAGRERGGMESRQQTRVEFISCSREKALSEHYTWYMRIYTRHIVNTKKKLSSKGRKNK